MLLLMNKKWIVRLLVLVTDFLVDYSEHKHLNIIFVCITFTEKWWNDQIWKRNSFLKILLLLRFGIRKTRTKTNPSSFLLMHQIIEIRTPLQKDQLCVCAKILYSIFTSTKRCIVWFKTIMPSQMEPNFSSEKYCYEFSLEIYLERHTT